MADNASRDENFVPTLLGVSNVDGRSPVTIYADPTTHRLLVDTVALSGVGAPSSTPTGLGQIYIATGTGKVYISVGTTNSGDWAIVN